MTSNSRQPRSTETVEVSVVPALQVRVQMMKARQARLKAKVKSMIIPNGPCAPHHTPDVSHPGPS